MINSINAIRFNYNETSTSNESAAQQLAQLIEEFRAHMNDTDPTQELAIMNKISDLLAKDGDLIEEECFQNGYRPGKEGFDSNYVTFLKQSLSLIKEAIQYHKDHPNEALPKAIVDQLNTSITQLHFLMITPNPY